MLTVVKREGAGVGWGRGSWCGEGVGRCGEGEEGVGIDVPPSLLCLKLVTRIAKGDREILNRNYWLKNMSGNIYLYIYIYIYFSTCA